MYISKIIIFNFIVLHYLEEGHSCASMPVEVRGYLWRSEGAWKPFLTFHHIGPENQTEFSRLGHKLHYPQSHSSWPSALCFETESLA